MPAEPPSDSASRAPTASVDALSRALLEADYVADRATSLVLYLALSLERPILVEGPAGVGKTELARAAARALDRRLIRLSCYEGLDESKALYDWDHAKQMLYTQLVRDALARTTSGATTISQAVELVSSSEASFYDRRFLLPRPLLAALESDTPAVLLIDEVDRADPEFEAFLLELLADMVITIPELGTIRAKHAPLVLLTTNGTREMTEALRRRCLHAFVEYPSPERELRILERRLPGIDRRLARSLTQFVAGLRALELRKAPSIGETLDWARTLLLLGKSQLDPDLVNETLGVLLKHKEDRTLVEQRAPALLQAVAAAEPAS
ncbi:MAG: MoxR family ATPase [Polyangiaceae bacterium]